MATYSGRLALLLRQFIDYDKPADFALKKELKLTSADERYKLLAEVKDYTNGTAICRGALVRDLEGLRCMLDGFTPQQKYDIMKMATDRGNTPLSRAVRDGKTYATSFSAKEIVAYLIQGLSPAHMESLLRIQTTHGNTALGCAAYYNSMDCIILLLSSIPLTQQQHLLTIKDNEGDSAADQFGPATLSTIQGLRDTQKKVEQQKQEIFAQKGEIGKLKTQLTEKKEGQLSLAEKCIRQEHELAEVQQTVHVQTENIAAQKAEIVELQKQLTERKEGQLSLVEKCIRQEHELAKVQQTVHVQTENIAAEKAEIVELQKQLAERKESQLFLTEKCLRQEEEMRELKETQQQMAGQQQQVLRAMTERQQAMEMMLEQLQIELSRHIVTDETGDQEIEELENY